MPSGLLALGPLCQRGAVLKLGVLWGLLAPVSYGQRSDLEAPPVETPAVVSLAASRKQSQVQVPSVLSLLSSSCFRGRPARTCARLEARLPTALLFIPVILHLARVPWVGPQGWGPQRLRAPLPQGGSPPVDPPLYSASLPWHRSLRDHFSSLPTHLRVDLYCSLGCTGVFLPVSSYPPVRIVPHVDVFLVCL